MTGSCEAQAGDDLDVLILMLPLPAPECWDGSECHHREGFLRDKGGMPRSQSRYKCMRKGLRMDREMAVGGGGGEGELG